MKDIFWNTVCKIKSEDAGSKKVHKVKRNLKRNKN
jgi:hypothetical protein